MGPDRVADPRRPRRGAISQIAIIALNVVFAACTRYHPLPLEPSALDRALAAPERSDLVEAAAHLRHPDLPPITLDFAKPLPPLALAVIAVIVNPELRALREKIHVAGAETFAAGLLPNPRLSGAVDHPVGFPSTAAPVFTAYNVALEWAVSALVTRPAKVRVARERLQQTRDDVAWQEWLIANKARLLARRLGFLEAQQAVADDAARLAGMLLDRARQALKHHDTTIDQVGLREVAYVDSLDRALALARDITKTRQALNRLLGLPPDEHLAVAQDTSPPPPPADAAALFVRAREARLDLAALRAGYAAQEAEVRGAVLGQFPAFSLGLGNARDTSAVTTIGLTIGLELPIFDRNQGAIAVARATRRQLYEEYVARLSQTRADIGTLVADLHRLAAEEAVLGRELPELAHASEVLARAAERGDVTLLAYEAVRAALFDKQLKQLEVEQAAAEQRVALDVAIGAPLIP